MRRPSASARSCSSAAESMYEVSGEGKQEIQLSAAPHVGPWQEEGWGTSGLTLCNDARDDLDDPHALLVERAPHVQRTSLATEPTRTWPAVAASARGKWRAATESLVRDTVVDEL